MQTSNQAIDESVLPEYFSEALACFERAVAVSARSTKYYGTGPYSFRLDFAGTALTFCLAPAFDHLETRDTSADCHIFLWDTQSTGVALPAPPWKWTESVRNEVHIGSRIKIVYNGDSGSLVMYDAETRRAVFWTRQASDIPYYEMGAPLLPVMHWWLASRGCQLVHAGAVGSRDGGVLLVGRGGSGKSTTALACLTGGLDFVSDDYCALSTDPAYIHGLYCSAKLAADGRNRLPALAEAIHRPEATPAEKTLYLLHRLYPGRLSAGFPLRAILLPRVAGTRETRLNPIPPAQALRALAPSTIFQLAGAGAEAFQRLAAVVRRVPSFEIAVGTDLVQIPATIRRILSEPFLSSPNQHGSLADA